MRDQSNIPFRQIGREHGHGRKFVSNFARSLKITLHHFLQGSEHEAADHQDVVNFSTLVNISAGNPANLDKAFPLIKTDCHRILCTYSQFQLPYADIPRKFFDRAEEFPAIPRPRRFFEDRP